MFISTENRGLNINELNIEPTLHPLKFNMEPENQPLKKRNSFENPFIF